MPICNCTQKEEKDSATESTDARLRIMHLMRRLKKGKIITVPTNTADVIERKVKFGMFVRERAWWGR
jgi:hypothetical protein